MFGQAFCTILGGNGAGKHSATGAVGVGDGIFQRDFFLFVYGIGGGMQHFHIFHVLYAMLLVCDVAEGRFVVHTRQHFVEVDQLVLPDAVVRLADDEVGTPDDVVHFLHAYFGQVFTYFAGKESEVIHKVFAEAGETPAQLRVLGSYTYGAGVLVAFAHHHASQYDEGGSGETVFFCTEHGHEHYVASGFQLTVHLQHHLSAQPVQHQRLLCLAQSEFGRYAGIADRAGGRCACAAFGTGDDNEVGFGFRHACGDSPHTAFGHQLHADLGFRVDVLQVEDELCQVLNGIDVVVGRRRNQ